jgi:hypothetical protein
MYDIKYLKLALCHVYCSGNQLWSKSVFLRRILYIHVYILPDRVYEFHFSDRITYNLWEKTKVETLSAVYTKNQNSKTVIKTIIEILVLCAIITYESPFTSFCGIMNP